MSEELQSQPLWEMSLDLKLCPVHPTLESRLGTQGDLGASEGTCSPQLSGLRPSASSCLCRGWLQPLASWWESAPLARIEPFQIKSQQKSSLLLLHKLSCNLCTQLFGCTRFCSVTPKSELTRGGWGVFLLLNLQCTAAASSILEAEDLGAGSALHLPRYDFG